MGKEHGAGPGRMAGRQDPRVRGQNKGIEGPGKPLPAKGSLKPCWDLPPLLNRDVEGFCG